MGAITKALENTDYKMLRREKLTLLKTITYLDKHRGHKLCIGDLEGLVNFLDAIQDAVAEDKIKTERQVFGRME